MSIDKPSSHVMRQGLMRVIEDGNVLDFYHESDARLYIGEVAVRQAGRLDIEATANRIGIDLEYNERMIFYGKYLRGSDWTNETGVPLITLSSMGEHLYGIDHTFGHEVGHHFLAEVLGMDFASTPHNDISEVFCEIFGAQMAAPGARSVENVASDAKKYYGIPENYAEAILDKYGRDGFL